MLLWYISEASCRIDTNTLIETPSIKSNEMNSVYISNVKSHKFKQKHITAILPESNRYKIMYSNGDFSHLNYDQLANILDEKSVWQRP